MSKNFLIISALIIFLTVLIVVFFLQKKSEIEDFQEESQSIKTADNGRFEEFLRENGKEIELPMLDVTNWQMYKDTERGFSFKYPRNWTVIAIDDPLKETAQENEKPSFWNDSIKGQIQSYEFLCLTDNERYADFTENPVKTSPPLDIKNCNIKFSESIPTWSGYDGTAWDLWTETHMKPASTSIKEYVIVDGRALMFSRSSMGIFFNARNNRMIESTDYNFSEKNSVAPEIFHTIIQTLSFNK